MKKILTPNSSFLIEHIPHCKGAFREEEESEWQNLHP